MPTTDTIDRPKVDISKGQCIGTVSNQWAMRPDDQRFTDLTTLRDQVAKWADNSHPIDLDPRSLTAEAHSGDQLLISSDAIDDGRIALAPTNYGFGDLCQLIGAPSRYLAKLPAELAARCLNHGFSNLKVPSDTQKQVYVGEPAGFDMNVLRCLTSPSYGRITDRDVVEEVMKFAGNGTGDTRWKVPGVMDWSTMVYNPNVDITNENTTLYASDRDIFLFLVDDKNPIEVGKTANGDPDLVFRGFYVWNSEVGERTFGVATMYLRGVCCNRLLWGVEGFSETSFRHSKGAPARFLTDCAPALQSFAEGAESKLIAGVKAAKEALVISPGADGEEQAAERLEFLRKLGFSGAKSLELVVTHIEEEGRPPESIWDFAQAMTAAARSCQYQDQRIKLEQQAGKLLDKVKVTA
jgi:hypothetical protein